MGYGEILRFQRLDESVGDGGFVFDDEDGKHANL
jgi:hypothetical protein